MIEDALKKAGTKSTKKASTKKTTVSPAATAKTTSVLNLFGTADVHRTEKKQTNKSKAVS